MRHPFLEKINAKSISGERDVFWSAESKNLGAGGILLENRFSVDVGSIIELCLVLDGKAITPRGKVVRSAQLATNRFDIGVSFLEKQESILLVVNNYVLNSPRQCTNLCQ